MSFRRPHIDVFAAIPFQPQPAYGRAPQAWAATMGIEDFFVSQGLHLPTTTLTRADVRGFCRDPYPVLYGYVAAMAWGDQGAGPGGTRHALAAWERREAIERLLTRIREEVLTRSVAYNLFAQADIKGLGPAYFTKLLYFFRAGAEHGQPIDRYIMDQWTAKSVNLLTGEHVVRMVTDNVTNWNTGENYEAFCREVERLASVLPERPGSGRRHTGEEVEQMLFSLGSIRRQPRWPWREHVEARWNADRPLHRYDAALVRSRMGLS